MAEKGKITIYDTRTGTSLLVSEQEAARYLQTGNYTRETPQERSRGEGVTRAMLRSNVIRELEAQMRASGYSPQSTEEVNALADQVLQSGNFGTPSNDEIPTVIQNNLPLITGFAQSYATRKTNEGVQRQIQDLINPQGTVTQEHKNTAASIISSVYGRNETQDEVDFFAKELAKGESPYELRQFLMTTPEYQANAAKAERERVRQESAAARDELGKALGVQRDEAFKRALPEILSAYMRSGRLGSSGVDQAIAKANQDLQRESESFLANAAYEDAVRSQGYRREDFVGNRANAFDQYLRQSDPARQRAIGLQGTADSLRFGSPFQQLQAGQGYASDRISRSRELDDYYRQQSDFFRALDNQRKGSREAALYGLLGSGISAGIQGATYAYAKK